MNQDQKVPYLLKFSCDYSKLLAGLTTFSIAILIFGSGIALGFLLINLLDAEHSYAGILFLIGIATPWIYLIIDDIYFRTRRANKKNSIYAKWCYIPAKKNSMEIAKQAWIQHKGHCTFINKPGFYILKAGYHVKFVGTRKEWEAFLEMAMNGGL